jgi:hypothetical protein
MTKHKKLEQVEANGIVIPKMGEIIQMLNAENQEVKKDK